MFALDEIVATARTGAELGAFGWVRLTSIRGAWRSGTSGTSRVRHLFTVVGPMPPSSRRARKASTSARRMSRIFQPWK